MNSMDTTISLQIVHSRLPDNPYNTPIYRLEKSFSSALRQSPVDLSVRVAEQIFPFFWRYQHNFLFSH